MNRDKQKLGILSRAAELNRDAVKDEDRTVELSFSAETPVERWFGFEILDHSPQSVRLDRMRGGAPLLVNHDRSDQVGVVETVSIDSDRRGRAVVRFGTGTRATEIFNDVKAGIRRLVSVGYRIHKLVTEKVEEEVETLRATDWEPMEVSIVSIPADPSVGVGRDADDIETVIERQAPTSKKAIPMKEDSPSTAPAVNIEVIREEASKASAKAERERIADIQKRAENLKQVYGESAARLGERAISEGMPVNDFLREAYNLPLNHKPQGTIGMSREEVQQYSIRKAIKNLADGKALDGLEREAHDAALKNGHVNRDVNARTVVVPMDVLIQRDQLVATASLGGNLRATNLLAGSFIEILRKRLVSVAAGAQMLPGLVGNVAIPRRSGSGTAYWVTEAQVTTESQSTFDQVPMTPKGVTGWTQFSRELLNQSTPAIDGLVQDDISKILALEIDRVCFHGSGSGGQPTGIAGTSGIGSVTGGTHGAAPTWANLVGLETEVAVDNADIGSLKYVTNANVRGRLKTTLKDTVYGGYIWSDGGNGDSTLNGYSALVSNQIANNLTKGTSTTICSAIFFGNFADLLIGEWGGLEILVDPYVNAATRLTNVYATQFIDLAVRHPESFALMPDALTA